MRVGSSRARETGLAAGQDDHKAHKSDKISDTSHGILAPCRFQLIHRCPISPIRREAAMIGYALIANRNAELCSATSYHFPRHVQNKPATFLVNFA